MPAKNRRTTRPPGPMNDAIIQAARTVFAYASTDHQRRHGPRGYTSYRAYKPWLRDEFAFRCVYCLSTHARAVIATARTPNCRSPRAEYHWLRISGWLPMVRSRL